MMQGDIPISGTPIIVERLERPLGWIQPYAEGWFSGFEEAVNQISGSVEEYARGYGETADDLPTDRQFADALRVIREARAHVKTERTRRRAASKGATPAPTG